MRDLSFAAVLLVLVAGCDGSSESLPSGDGYGPLGNGSSGTGATPSPTSAPTSTAAPTSPPPTPPPPSSWSDAGWHDAGWSDAGGSGAWGWEAGDDDAGTWQDAGGWATDAGTPSALLALCVGEINELRNQNGAFPYVESSALEYFAAKAASSDAQTGQLHGYFDQTSGGGIAFTENEYDGAQIDPGGTAQQVLSQGLLDDEDGNGGGFVNLVTNQFSEVGCGFAQDGTGNWWVTIELR